MESSPTYFGVEDVELKELADALKILHVYCDTKDWNEDDFISVFEELTGAYYTIFSRYLRAESYSVIQFQLGFQRLTCGPVFSVSF